uniref:Transposase n=1 Tax=Quercus lobata TaxID=97700 RepID=A0A7N2L115_QUELO
MFGVSLAELREEESLLLTERINLKNELAALCLTLEKQRATNDSLERIKVMDSMEPTQPDVATARPTMRPPRPPQEYMADSKIYGTSNLKNHTPICPEYLYNELHDGQDPLSKDVEEGNLVPRTFTNVVGRKVLAEMIILDELPFRFVENQGFRRFCNVFQPNFNIPSRFTVAKDVSRIYFEEKDKLRNALRGRRLCLTTDTWTSIQNFNYMCLTCHFIDDDWKLHKRILNFCIVNNHKGKTIGKMVESCLEEWNIEVIFTLTVDNASSNDVAISYLKEATNRWKGTVLGNEFVHVRCCAHILNLIVTDGLKHHNKSIDRVRHAVRYVKASPNRLQTFKRCVEKMKIESKAILCLDVATRWNSTYKMLENSEKLEHAFKRMEYEDLDYILHFWDRDYDRRPPNEDDWETCRKFVKFLKLFYNATKRSDDHFLYSMAKTMIEKFDKYWGSGEDSSKKGNVLLYVAVVLDPRKKLDYLNYCLLNLYGENVAKVITDLVENVLKRLYEHYNSTHSSYVSIQSASEISRMEGVGVDVDDDDDDLDRFIACQYKAFRQGKQPVGILSRLARDVLAVPVSTMTSKLALSTGGRILDPFRSSLALEMVESLICTQNWLQSSVQISLRQAMDDVELFEDYGKSFLEAKLDSPSVASPSPSSTVTNLD